MTQEQYKKIADVVCRYEGNKTKKRSYQHDISVINQEIKEWEKRKMHTEMLIEKIDREIETLEKEIEAL